MTCANCGGNQKVALVTPDLDIQPIPLCQLCRVLGLDRSKWGLCGHSSDVKCWICRTEPARKGSE